jgi:hypothetical protein
VGYAPPSTPEPILVFISSDSDEFADLRLRLQECIDSEYMYNSKRTLEEDSPKKAELVHQGKIMKGILVEKGSEESFEEAMKRGIKRSQIYVGIFGDDHSEPTQKEYDFARQLGLPLLVYYFTEPAKVAKGVHTKVVRLLKNKAENDHVHIRGNYRRIEAREPNELIDIILSDLACKVADFVREGTEDRRMLLESAPDAAIGAILRAKRTVFD